MKTSFVTPVLVLCSSNCSPSKSVNFVIIMLWKPTEISCKTLYNTLLQNQNTCHHNINTTVTSPFFTFYKNMKRGVVLVDMWGCKGSLIRDFFFWRLVTSTFFTFNVRLVNHKNKLLVIRAIPTESRNIDMFTSPHSRLSFRFLIFRNQIVGKMKNSDNILRLIPTPTTRVHTYTTISHPTLHKRVFKKKYVTFVVCMCNMFSMNVDSFPLKSF
jgi:hypothetical protein